MRHVLAPVCRAAGTSAHVCALPVPNLNALEEARSCPAVATRGSATGRYGQVHLRQARPCSLTPRPGAGVVTHRCHGDDVCNSMGNDGLVAVVVDVGQGARDHA
jgi:hypothetical protein